MISKIIHQTWKSRELPGKYARWVETFKIRHPDWEYRFWDDEDCYKFVEQHFPGHLEAYNLLTNPAQKADLFRYMVLYTFGGLYADVDCECKRTLDFIKPDDDFIVARELQTSSSKVMALYHTDLEEVFCNWAILSRPQHPILMKVIDSVRANSGLVLSDNPLTDTVKRTGPHALTKAVKDYLAEGCKVSIVPSSYFGCCNTRNAFTLAVSWMFPELFRKVYIRHHFETSWLDKKTKEEFLKRNIRLSTSSSIK